MSQDKISRCWWGAASSTVDFWFPFPGHLPSHLVAGRRKTKQIPFPSPCFRTSLKFPWHQQNLGEKKLCECLSENPTLPPCHVVDFSPCFKGLASYFPAYGFTLHLHTEIIHSICENHLLKQTYLLVWCSLNRAIICYRHMLHCVWDTGLVVRNPETHHSLDPCEVIQLFEDLSSLIMYLFHTFWFSMHFQRTLCSDVSFVLLWYHSWNSQTMPAITWKI